MGGTEAEPGIPLPSEPWKAPANISGLASQTSSIVFNLKEWK